MSEDSVQLDGLDQGQDWPVELAELLVTDQTPWGLGPTETGPNLSTMFYRLAMRVNARNRHRGGYEWAKSVLDRIEVTPLTAYATQDLLDVVNIVCRTDHFRTGTLRTEEPRLRLLLKEIIRRTKSDEPPIFVKTVS